MLSPDVVDRITSQQVQEIFAVAVAIARVNPEGDARTCWHDVQRHTLFDGALRDIVGCVRLVAVNYACARDRCTSVSRRFHIHVHRGARTVRNADHQQSSEHFDHLGSVYRNSTLRICARGAQPSATRPARGEQRSLSFRMDESQSKRLLYEESGFLVKTTSRLRTKRSL